MSSTLQVFLAIGVTIILLGIAIFLSKWTN